MRRAAPRGAAAPVRPRCSVRCLVYFNGWSSMLFSSTCLDAIVLRLPGDLSMRKPDGEAVIKRVVAVAGDVVEGP